MWQGFPVTSSDTKLLSPYIDHATVKSLPLTLSLHSMRGRGPLEREHVSVSLAPPNALSCSVLASSYVGFMSSIGYMCRKLHCIHMTSCTTLAGRLRNSSVPTMPSQCSGQSRSVRDMWRECVPVPQVQVCPLPVLVMEPRAMFV